MQLVFNARWERWEAITRYGEGDAPRAAGMLWDRASKCWHTKAVSYTHLTLPTIYSV